MSHSTAGRIPMIKFGCTNCGQAVIAKCGSAGKQARCPKCQTVITVPAEVPAEKPQLAVVSQPASVNDFEATGAFVRINGKIAGPLSASDLKRAVEKGLLKGEHELSTDKVTWIQADQVEDLFIEETPTVLELAEPLPYGLELRPLTPDVIASIAAPAAAGAVVPSPPGGRDYRTCAACGHQFKAGDEWADLPCPACGKNVPGRPSMEEAPLLMDVWIAKIKAQRGNIPPFVYMVAVLVPLAIIFLLCLLSDSRQGTAIYIILHLPYFVTMVAIVLYRVAKTEQDAAIRRRCFALPVYSIQWAFNKCASGPLNFLYLAAWLGLLLYVPLIWKICRM